MSCRMKSLRPGYRGLENVQSKDNKWKSSFKTVTGARQKGLLNIAISASSVNASAITVRPYVVVAITAGISV